MTSKCTSILLITRIIFFCKQESDVDASFSSHDSDEDGGPSFGAKRFKREIVQDIFEENGNRNGRGSPINEQVVMDVVMNGNHSNDVPRDGKSEMFI